MAMSNNERDDLAEVNRQQTEARLQEIEIDVKKQSLVSERRSLSDLESQYQDAMTFLAGLKALEKDYEYFRMVRGDGNCYYRAFLYLLCENILNNKDEGERILKWIKGDSWKAILQVGYDEYTLETFYDTVVELFENILDGKVDHVALHKELNQENSTSDYCTWYLRVLTATHLKMDPDRFLPFLEQPGLDINQYCQREVEPMAKECTNLEVLALAEELGVRVHIEYLDGRDLHGKLSKHSFGPENATLDLYTLYRPGHYDILYKR